MPKYISKTCVCAYNLGVVAFWATSSGNGWNISCRPLEFNRRPDNASHATVVTQVQGLVTLLYGYVLALFIVGSQVRDCHWLPQGEGDIARPLLSCCLRVDRLTLGYEDKG